jgi:hypothetical protein
MARAEQGGDERIVYGRITYSDTGRPAVGVRVTAMDADFLFDDVLGSATSDDDGRFSITYGVEQFRDLFERAPDIYLIVADDKGEVITTTRDAVVRNAGRVQETHVQLPGRGPKPPVHVVPVGGLNVDRKTFDALTRDDLRLVARAVMSDKPDEKAIRILNSLHPSLADDLVRPKLCGTPVRKVLYDIVRVKDWPREVLLNLEDVLTGYPRFGGFTAYSCPPFLINYDTTGSAAVNPTVSVTDITVPGTATVVGATTAAAGSPPNYIQRLCFWLQRAYATYTGAPFALRSPSGTITVDVIVDPGYGHGSKNHITIDHGLSDDLLGWVSVHELMHVIQAEYVTSGTAGGWDPGMSEGGAVLGEDTVIDPINRYAGEADNFFGEGTLRHPETSLQNLSYKLSLFLKYLTEQQSSRVFPGDEPLIGVETYRHLLESFDAAGYTTAAFSQAVGDLPWYQSFYDFGYLDAARLDETWSETLLGNFWMACYLKDLGVSTPDRRFDFMEDEEICLADDIFPAGAPGPIGTLRSVVLQADVSLATGGTITLSSGAGGSVDPFAARFYKVAPAAGVNTLRVNFTAGAGFTRPLVQVALVEPGNVVRDILRSDRATWSRTIANDRSGTKLDHLLIIVAGSNTGGSFTLSAQDVPAAPDVMISRWHHAAGTHYEIDSFNWAWTWVSPDIWVDTNLDGVADDEVYFNQNNKLFVRLHNQGNAAATGIQVQFWYQDASGGLSDAAWQPVRNDAGVVQTLTGLTLPAQSASPVPPAAGANAWSVDWAPAPSGTSRHFCVRAVVTVPGDPNTDNKRCLSNFGNVIESTGFVDLTLLRRAFLDRYEKVRLFVIPRARGRYSVSQVDLDRLNGRSVKVGTELIDELRLRRMNIESRLEAMPHAGEYIRQMGGRMGRSGAEQEPDPWGHYPTDPRALPPGVAQADLVTISHVVNGKPIGGFTWAIRQK